MFAAFFACSIQGVNAQNADAGDVETGLVGWWKLDEANSPYADSSSTNLPASDVGSATTPAPAKIGNGINFISAGRIQTASSPIFAGLTEVSYAGWIRMNDFSTGGYNGVVHIQGHSAVFLGWNNNRVGLLTNSWTTQNGNWGVNSRLINGQWNHFVVTYDISAPQGTPPQIYINGVQYPHSTAFTTIGSYTNPASSTVAIGAADISGWRNFDGDIDDIRIYNRILSADDVALLYRSYPGQVACDATHEAVMIFNHNEKVMQYCNGTDWVNITAERSVPSTNGLTGHWTLNDTNTTAANTASGSNDGTMNSGLSGATNSVTGIIGSALDFDGVDDFIDAGSISTLAPTTVTSCAWVNRTGNGSGNNWQEVMGSGQFNTYGWHLNLEPEATTATFFVIQSGSRTPVSFNLGSTLGWHHYCGSWDGTNARLYVDGVLRGTSGATTMVSSSNNFFIGSAGPASPGSDTVDGYIDDVRVYNRALSDTEIASIYSASGMGKSVGCTSPNGKAGEMDYNLEEGVMQYCDGENWISMGPKSAEAGVSAADLSPTAPTSGLIGHWPLNTNANDALGNSNGSLQNGAAIITTNKKLGVGAVELDGTNDHVRVPTTSNINLAGTDEMSVSLWVDLDSVSSGANSLIMWESVNGGNQEEPYRLNVWDAGGGQYFPSFELANASDSTVRLDAGNLNYNGWHHVVGTYDGTEMRIYVDGQLANSAAQTGLIKTPVDGALNVDLLIGSGEISTARFTNGTIDDVRLYNRKLEPDEVQNLYRASSLAAHWKMDETGSTNTAVDSSGNGFNAAMLNGLSGANTTAGKTGSALQIDGTDDRMTVPFNSALHPSQITFCAWVKVNTPTGGYPAIAVTQVWPNRGYNFSMDDVAGDVTWSVFNGAPNNLTFNTTVTNWHHYCGTADGYTQNLYVDGNLVGTQAAGYVPMTSGILYLASTTVNVNTLNGDIDDIRMYNRVLSAEEIATLYATTGGGGIPISGCPNIGDTCDDGTIYAGISPDGDIPMYTTAADETGTYAWNNGNAAGTYTGTLLTDCNENGPGSTISACVTGFINTETIISEDSDAVTGGVQIHQAAQQCADLTSGGYDDWYLPAMEELWILYNNRVTIGGFGTGFYWSSSEDQAFNARRINFGTGAPNNTNKENALSIRCVRKGSVIVGGTCSSPRGVAGEIVYNDDYNLMQYCNGSEWVALGSDYSGSAVVLSPPAGTGDCPNIGDVCPDGSIYAGFSTDGNIRMFTTPADAPGGAAYSWNAGNASSASMPFVTADPCYMGPETGCQTGALNTSAAASADSDTSNGIFDNHIAAKYCEDLASNGKNDWYLPAQEELEILYNNRAIGSLSGTFASAYPDHTYWSSSEVNNQAVIIYSFDGSGGNNSTKENTWSVRCVRKDAASTAADPCDGTPAIGTTCNNGSIYAGTSPFDGGDLYMTNVSFETTTEWSSTETSLLGLSNTTNGSENTAILIGTGANYEAAQYCDSLSAHGETDWYLPAEDETANFWNGGSPIGGVETSGAYYWASTEFDATRARGRNYQFGAMTQTAKSNALLVRCVRKVGGTPTDACSGSPSVGATCSNGSIYAGLSPDGNVKMYTTPADAGTMPWAIGTVATHQTTGVTNTITGESNTAALVAIDSDIGTAGTQLHTAAQYCYDLNAHGQTDWYLPAEAEMAVLYAGKNTGPLNGTYDEVCCGGNSYYWTSVEYSSDVSRARHTQFQNGGTNQGDKTQNRGTRCVRKD